MLAAVLALVAVTTRTSTPTLEGRAGSVGDLLEAFAQPTDASFMLVGVVLLVAAVCAGITAVILFVSARRP